MQMIMVLSLDILSAYRGNTQESVEEGSTVGNSWRAGMLINLQ